MPSPKKPKSSWAADPSAYCPLALGTGDSYLIFVPEQRVIEVHLHDNGIVDQVVHYPNGTMHKSRSFCGIVDLSSWGGIYVPEKPLHELLPFKVGETKEALLTSQDAEATKHCHRLMIAKQSTIIIGRCRYDTLEIQCYSGSPSSPYGLSHTHTIDFAPDLGIPLTHRMGRHGNVLAGREIRHISELSALLKTLQTAVQAD